MSAFRKLGGLTGADRSLLFRAGLALCLTSLGLWLAPRRFLRRALAHAETPGNRGAGRVRHSPSRIGWAVRAAARYVPGASTCLPQAIACRALLDRDGHPAHLRIGVASASPRELRAHAWVESGGEVVIGESASGPYTPLPNLGAARK